MKTIKTGVFSRANIKFLVGELCGPDVIWPKWEEHKKTCPDGDDCQCDLDVFDPELIGYRASANQDFDCGEDPSAEYSAIVSSSVHPVIQVTKSKWIIKGAMCSPCFPDQVDADCPGEHWGYSLPPEVLGKDWQGLKRIRKLCVEPCCERPECLDTQQPCDNPI